LIHIAINNKSLYSENIVGNSRYLMLGLMSPYIWFSFSDNPKYQKSSLRPSICSQARLRN